MRQLGNITTQISTIASAVLVLACPPQRAARARMALAAAATRRLLNGFRGLKRIPALPGRRLGFTPSPSWPPVPF